RDSRSARFTFRAIHVPRDSRSARFTFRAIHVPRDSRSARFTFRALASLIDSLFVPSLADSPQLLSETVVRSGPMATAGNSEAAQSFAIVLIVTSRVIVKPEIMAHPRRSR
ncbi:MAG: hypothetical protein N2C14_31345, partial [Planctomycetales bacterium]